MVEHTCTPGILEGWSIRLAKFELSLGNVVI